MVAEQLTNTHEILKVRTEMSVELLDLETVVPYLKSRGLLAGSSKIEVEEISGGVSNVVLGVRDESSDLVLKQALAELKVEAKWVADQRRAIVEARAIELYHSMSPKVVPQLLDSDPERFTLTMQRAPRSTRVWKSELLSGNINPKIGAKLGQILAGWHAECAQSKAIQKTFAEDSLFEQLRISPFYREISLKNPSLVVNLSKLIAQLKEEKSTIVHGDFSPKNFLVDQDEDVYVLDFEVAHYGNPVFDLAFTLAHLLCKYFRTDSKEEEEALKLTAKSFVTGYSAICVQPLPESLALHTAALALSRVEGKSRVDYLGEAAQEQVKKLTKKVLSDFSTIDPVNLFIKEFS